MNTDNLSTIPHRSRPSPRRNLCRKGNRRMVAEFQCHHIGASRLKTVSPPDGRISMPEQSPLPSVFSVRRNTDVRLQHHLARQNLRRVRCSGYGNGSFQRKPHRIRCGRPTARFPVSKSRVAAVLTPVEQPGNFYPRKLSSSSISRKRSCVSLCSKINAEGTCLREPVTGCALIFRSRQLSGAERRMSDHSFT